MTSNRRAKLFENYNIDTPDFNNLSFDWINLCLFNTPMQFSLI